MGERESRPFRESQGRVQATLDDRARPTLHGPLLLVTLFLASIPLYPSNDRIFASFAANDEVVAAFVGSMFGACVAVGIGLLLYGSWRPAWNGWGWKMSAAAVVGYCAAQGLLWGPLIVGAVSVPVAVVAGIGCGTFAGPVMYLWIRCFDVGFRDILFHGAIACAASTALTWLIALLPLVPAAMAMMGCAAGGSIAPWLIGRAARAGKDERSAAKEPCGERASGASSPTFRATAASLLSVTWLPLLGCLLSCFMMSALTTSVGGIVNSEFTGAAVASVLGLAVCLLARKTSLVVLVNRLVLPLSMAVCLVLGSSPDGTFLFELGMATVYGPLIFLSLYGFAALVAVVDSDEFPLSVAFGALFLAASLVSLAGFAFGMATAGNETLAGQTLWALVAAYIAVVLVYLGYDSYRALAHPAALTGDGDNLTGAAAAKDADRLAALKSAQIAEVAEDAALSKRELEVFDFIARGYNSTYIANSLFISPNTARTHIRNIYRKLGVTSREELLESLNREE